ncbi:MAG TPA: GAF domain-containing protein, partial [Actinoplanes sp.]
MDRALMLSEYLDLLAREAAPVEFERPVLAARAAGAPPSELKELDELKMNALRVRALLERRRRREEELSGLYDTASDLAGLRDLDAVLRAIVHRARTLLGADVTYLTLNDAERGDTFMRITDGSVAASFQSLRLPAGAGLGGLVAVTGTPYSTANYGQDPRFAHTTEIDHGVRDEGLVAILGVPLRLGSAVIGVLFASNRTERPFAREEVALLGSLAAHAAIAIDTARLLADTQEALASLSAANRTIQEHSASVERAAAAHDRMTALVLRGGGVEDLAADLVEVLTGAVLVLDAEGRELATAKTAGDPPARDEVPVGEAVAASRGEGRSVRRADLYVAAVVAGADDLGALVFRPAHDLAGADQRILERAAQVTALLLLFRRTVAEAEGQVRGELLDDLINRPVRDDEALRSRTRRLGVDLDSPHVLVVASFDGSFGASPGGSFGASPGGSIGASPGGSIGASPGGSIGASPGGSIGASPGGSFRDEAGGSLGADSGVRQRALSWARSFAGGRGGLAAAQGSRVALMLAGSDAGDAARRVARELGRALNRPVTAGGAGP